jgi:DNA invertase Pin-like site-specific DNA recombinase
VTASEADNAARAVLYARVSTQEQTKGYSIRQQLEALRDWCAVEGYEVLEECADPGDSGQHLERAGLDRARDLVESGRASLIVAQDADRITREPAHRLLLDSEVERRGARLVALDDWGDDTHEGHLLRYMRGWVAKGELLKTAERTRRGLARKIREGKVIRGRRPPMGFAYADEGDRLVPSEPEMGAVRLIFSMIGARGASMGETARALRDLGMRPPGGGNWHRQTIRRVVLSELYRPLTMEEAAGSGLLSREAASGLDSEGTYGLWTFDTKRRKKWKERGPDDTIRTRYSVEPRPREQWQAVAVDLSGSGLSRAHVDAARESLKGNTRRAASTVAQRFWELSGGVARCGVCGNAMSPHTTSRAGGRKAPYYRCFQRYNSGPRDCTNTKTLPAAPLEEAVWQKVRILLEEPERVMAAYDAYVELRGRRLGGDPDREALELSARL